MFDRITYKKFARRQLKNRWTIPVLVILLATVVDALFSIPTFVLYFKGFFDFFNGTSSYRSLEEAYIRIAEATNSFSIKLSSYIGLLVQQILYFATIRLFVKMSESPEPVSFNTFLEGLNMWFRAILAFLWTSLWTALWTLLFIIPGIVKAVAYSQTYFLATEYPHMTIRKALQLSKVMTKGYKGDLFVMYLSFIGWGLLCILTFGIGYLWLKPYATMSLVNAYKALKKQAVDSGTLSLSDFS